ncbi:SDR family oxidoreductase [Nitrosopumilus sp.]|nr:SDR family oxidoreductase [Nitrosopumilus sp.]
MEENILKNKNCLITGATGGLGRELSIELAKKGCNLFLTSKEANLEDLKSKIEQVDSEISVISQLTDLRNTDDVNSLINHVREKFSHIDILINCAGENHRKPIVESTLEEYDSCMNLNVRAPFILSKEFSKDMVKNNWGRIVNIASSSAHNGFKDAAIYCSSKHALLGLSRTLFAELKDKNIRTFCVSPGSMKTRMAKEDEGLLAEHDYNTFMDPNEVAEFITKIISYDNEMISQEINLTRLRIN